MPVSAPSTLHTASQTHSYTWRDACMAACARACVCAHTHTHTHTDFWSWDASFSPSVRSSPTCKVDGEPHCHGHEWTPSGSAASEGPRAEEPAEGRVQGPSGETAWGHKPRIGQWHFELLPHSEKKKETWTKAPLSISSGAIRLCFFRLCVTRQQFLSAGEKHPAFGVGAGVVFLNSEAL